MSLGAPLQRRAQGRSPSADPAARACAERPHLRGEVPIVRLAAERFLQMARLYRNWPTALADRLGVLPDGRHLLYRIRSDGANAELIARANGCDVRTISEIWIGGLYDRLMDPRALCGRQVAVLDIGANCGYFAAYIAHRYPAARIVCFEPEAENRALAEANIALNGVKAEIRPEAVVAGRMSSVRLNLSRDTRLHTTVPLERASSHGIDARRYSGLVVDVPAVNINDAVYETAADGRIDLLKIDVEGVDLELVAAMENDALLRIDCIVAETENRDTGGVSERLATAGFSVTEDASLLFAVRPSGLLPPDRR